ncbi:hypothetical protein ACFY9F_36030 [Streptomyces sp. NPDC012421]|uniref:hypothetical protein n=1 Tax=Streptomyces sp. NPDC012421 TaxID=3364832 RepID=UPI0036E0B5DC
MTSTDPAHYGPLTIDGGTELRPIYDPRLRTFSVQLWKNGEPAGIHGLTTPYLYADEATVEIVPFLQKHGIRVLSGPEMVHLCGALLRAKNPAGPDFQLFLMKAARSRVTTD